MRGNSIQPKHVEVKCGDQSLRIRYVDFGEGMPLLYLHGWGCDYTIFYPLMEQLEAVGRHIALDFPGFGESKMPLAVWGTEDYADCVLQVMRELGLGPCIVVGHSFGCRVAARSAKRAKERMAGMVWIAAAGIKRKTPWRRRMKIKTIRATARWAERCLPGDWGRRIKDHLYRRIASRDYLSAGDLRPIFVRVVNEDLTGLLPDIRVPTLLIYGSDDRETPPDVGRRLHELLAGSKYIEIPGFDHFSILDRGKFQVGAQIRRFLEELQEEKK